MRYFFIQLLTDKFGNRLQFNDKVCNLHIIKSKSGMNAWTVSSGVRVCVKECVRDSERERVRN